MSVHFSSIQERKVIYAYEDDMLAMRAENEKMRAAIKKYLSHQLGHAESYKVLREAINK